jgi:hypothetical protein
MIQVMTVGALLFIVVATNPQIQALREAKLAKLEAEREASTRAYDEWMSQQNLIQEQYQQEKEMLATGSVGSIPDKSVKWLKYKCACNKGQFSVKQDPNWGDGYFILYCKGVTK